MPSIRDSNMARHRKVAGVTIGREAMGGEEWSPEKQIDRPWTIADWQSVLYFGGDGVVFVINMRARKRGKGKKKTPFKECRDGAKSTSRTEAEEGGGRESGSVWPRFSEVGWDRDVARGREEWVGEGEKANQHADSNQRGV